MGVLVIGEDIVALARHVRQIDSHRTEPRTTFGWLSAAGVSAARRPIREWLADQVDRQDVVPEALWQQLLVLKLKTNPGPWTVVQPLLVEAVNDLLLRLSSEGLSPTDVRPLLRRLERDHREDAERLSAILPIWKQIEEEMAERGLLSRTAALAQVRPLAGRLNGIVDEYPGAMAAQTLLKAVREQEQAVLGLLYAPDDRAPFVAAQRFLDATTDQQIGIDEVTVAPLVLDKAQVWRLNDAHLPPLERIEQALDSQRVDVVVGQPTLFRTVSELWQTQASIFGPAHPPLLDYTWLQSPLERAVVLDWWRGQGTVDLSIERRLLASPATLSREQLPAELLTRLRHLPTASCSIGSWHDAVGQWLDVPTLFLKAARSLQWQLEPALWATLAKRQIALEYPAQARPSDGRPALLCEPWLPSGDRPALFLASTINQQRPRFLSARAERLLARTGLYGFAATPAWQLLAQSEATVRETHLAERRPLSVVPALLPEPPTVPSPSEVSTPTRVTVSALIDYVQCPQRYYLQRFVPTKTPPQALLSPLEMGTVTHRAAEQVLRPLIGQSLTPLLIADVLGRCGEYVTEQARRYRGAFALQDMDIVRLEAAGHHLEQRLRRDLERLLFHHGKIAGLEWTVETEREGLTIVGRIDRVDELPGLAERKYWLWDLKSGRSTPSLGEPRTLQLALYGEMFGWEKVDALAFEALLSDEMTGASADPRLTGGDIKMVANLQATFAKEQTLVAGALAGLRAGDFAPRPFGGEETCRLCHVRPLCRYSPSEQVDDAT